jgi:hypothetical protein
MAFVKLDCGILDSTLWVDREARELFVTALLMAEPMEIRMDVESINVSEISPAGFIVPAGWYGFVPAAGPGIIRRAGIDRETGMKALERLCAEDDESRTPDFEGRRMARVDGGFIILNYDKYRQKDYTAAERMSRYRDRKKHEKQEALRVTLRNQTVTDRNVTEEEAEVEAEVEAKVKEKKESKSEKLNISSKAKPGSQDELNAYFAEVGLTHSDADYAWNHWESKGWKNGRDTIKDWKAAVRSWKAAGYYPSQKDGFTPKAAPKPKPKPNLPDGWQEIASDYFERPIECEFDDLSADDQFALQNHIRYMEEAA